MEELEEADVLSAVVGVAAVGGVDDVEKVVSVGASLAVVVDVKAAVVLVVPPAIEVVTVEVAVK